MKICCLVYQSLGLCPRTLGRDIKQDIQLGVLLSEMVLLGQYMWTAEYHWPVLKSNRLLAKILRKKLS